MTTKPTIVAIIVGIVCLPCMCLATQLTFTPDEMTKIGDLEKKLFVAERDLLQMYHPLHGLDREIGSDVLDAAREVVTAVYSVVDVETLHRNMENAADKHMVGESLRNDIESADQTCEANLKLINESITELQSSALQQQVFGVRDLVRDLCSIVHDHETDARSGR